MGDVWCASFTAGICGSLECFDCGTRRHQLHEGMPGFEDCLACKLQTVQVNSSGIRRLTHQGEVLDRPSAPPRVHNNSWEKGIAKDHRGVPYLDSSGDHIPIKKFGENRHKYDEAIRTNRNAPAPT